MLQKRKLVKKTKTNESIYSRVGRPRIPISTVAGVFQSYNERHQQISLLWDDPWCEEARQARRLNKEKLQKRLKDFSLDHRFDFR